MRREAWLFRFERRGSFERRRGEGSVTAANGFFRLTKLVNITKKPQDPARHHIEAVGLLPILYIQMKDEIGYY